MIAIIDYGAGNLHSVKNALDSLSAESVISNNPEEILSADKIILPGVGAFGDAMEALERSGLTETVRRAVELNKPLLGICLGLHLLFEESEETPDVKGLGILKGRVAKIPKAEGIKIPHMGWNSLEFPKESRILKGIGDEPYLYFVHSYYVQPEDEAVVSAYTDYGNRLAVAVEKGNLFAVQFHPEKSGDTGHIILENFLNLE